MTLAASVPDTWIGTLVRTVRESKKIRAVDAAREEEAVAIACGAGLAGGRGAVLIQNAGLFNCGGVLAGLVQLYRIPCFFIVSYRGDGRDPVYYHAPKGRVTEPTLSAWRVPFAIADRAADVEGQVVRGVEAGPAPRASRRCSCSTSRSIPTIRSRPTRSGRTRSGRGSRSHDGRCGRGRGRTFTDLVAWDAAGRMTS